MFNISTSIEISAPPEKVREIFLDFPHLSSWLSTTTAGSGITNIQVEDKNKKSGIDLQPGDIVLVSLGEKKTKFKAEVLLNTPSEFKWLGSLPYIFSGEHSFRFEKSSAVEGGTRFVNSEEFSGVLSPVMSGWLMGGSTREGFEGLNGRVKRRVESGRGV